MFARSQTPLFALLLVSTAVAVAGCPEGPEPHGGDPSGAGSGASSSSGGGSGPGASSSSSGSSAGGAGGGSASSSTGSSSGAGGAPPGGGFGAVVSKDLYDQMFLHRNVLFDYDSLVTAAASYPTFCNEGSADDRKREAAAFLANISHETTGGWPAAPDGPHAWGLYFTQEVGCENGACTGYCDANNVQYPCAPGKTYHGRGPIQLSWNYNYGAVGQELGLPLLTDPDLVTSDGVISFKTGVWFWSTPQAPKPSCHDVMTGQWVPSPADVGAGRKPGFGMTINIINGGLECGFATPAQVEDRVGFYMRYTQMLGVDPGLNLYCDTMMSY